MLESYYVSQGRADNTTTTMPNMTTKTISRLIGAAGVAATENRRARRVGSIFEVPMLVAALGILLRWWSQTSSDEALYTGPYFDLALWGLFVLESTLLSLLVDNPRRYLKGNWLNLVIIGLGIPVLFSFNVDIGFLRLLRLLIVFSLLIHVGSRVHKMLSRNELATTLIASAIVIVMAGVMIAALEPDIHTPWQGIWWAWVTVTTVGYGDIVPKTPQGRLFGGLVILMGIALFSMITAAFAAFFISQKENEVLDEERAEYRKICDLEERIYALENQITDLIKELRSKN